MAAVAGDSLAQTFIAGLMWHFATIYSAMSEQSGFGEGRLFIERTANTRRETATTSSFNAADGIMTLLPRSK